MSYLYVTEQGSTLSAEGGYFIVNCKDGVVRKIPKETLEYVAVFGGVQITAKAIQQFITRNIVVNVFSSTGSYFGRIESTENTNIFRQRLQFKRSDDIHFKTELSKIFIKSKIDNQCVILKRYGKESVHDSILKMKQSRDKIDSCNAVDEIMGYEGIAAREYFGALSNLVNPDFKFNGRSKRPPRDAFNSMLSLGYTLLMNEIYGSIIGKGMSPYAGFMHSDREHHPTLCSDMMEEWRSVLIDSTVLSLVQGREVDIDDFTENPENGGILLGKKSFNTFIKKYESKMRVEMRYLSYLDYSVSFRKAIWHQVSSLFKAIEENDPQIYKPVLIR